MEVSSTNRDEEILAEKLSLDDSNKEVESENFENDIEKVPVEDAFQSNNTIDYDDDDSGDDFAVITKTSNANDSSPAKTMFSIKTISNSQIQNNYKLSKTAVDLDHPGNINGVPTIDYDLSKLVDEFKPWKKPGADVSDYFNYGFTEETWLLYCEKQKTLRLSQENSALKTLSGLQNFGYPLSGSHIHLGFNRNNHKNSKGGLIDVISSQQNEYKNKHNDINFSMVNKISTIPVQTGNVNVGPNQANNYISGLANQAINNNLLNPIMSAAMAMGILPNTANVQVLTNPSNAPIDTKLPPFNSVDGNSGGGGGGVRSSHGYGGSGMNAPMGNPGPNWSNQTGSSYDRSNSIDSMHSHEEYERKPYMKSDRNNRHEESRRYRSRERRDRSSERRRRSRSRSRDRAHESKHSRKRNRTPEESSSNRRHRKHSRDRHSSDESDRKHRRHRSSKRHRQTRSRSRSYDRKDRHQRRHKSPEEESVKYKSYKDDNLDISRSETLKNDGNGGSNDNNNSSSNNVKREMDYSNNAD